MSEDINFSSTLITSLVVEMIGSKAILGAQAFVLSSVLRTLAHLLDLSPAISDPIYVIWLTRDYSVMTWILKSIEEMISGSGIFLTTAKEMWDTLKALHDN